MNSVKANVHQPKGCLLSFKLLHGMVTESFERSGLCLTVQCGIYLVSMRLGKGCSVAVAVCACLSSRHVAATISV